MSDPAAAVSKREKFERLLAADPGDPFLRYSVALEHRAEGNDAAALEGLTETIRRSPDYHPAHFMKGQLLAAAGRTDEAREVLLAGVELATRAGDGHAAGEMSGFVESLPAGD